MSGYAYLCGHIVMTSEVLQKTGIARFSTKLDTNFATI